jgi:hypothetical protein
MLFSKSVMSSNGLENSETSNDVDKFSVYRIGEKNMIF